MTPTPEDIEARLRRYRPEGPPAGFRERIIALSDLGGGQLQKPRGRSRTLLEWLPASAAAAAAVFFYLAAFDLRADLSATASRDDEREEAVRTLADRLGGGDDSRQVAERLVSLAELEALDDQPAGLTDVEVAPHD